MNTAHPPSREFLERTLASSREWSHLVSDGFTALNSDLEFELRMRTRALLAEREAQIHAGDPGPLADADAALRARLLEQAQRSYWELFRGAQEVAEQVAETLALPQPHHFAGLPVRDPVDLVTALAPPRPHRSGAPLATRILRVFRPGWSGIMMIFVVTRLLDLHLPGGMLGLLAAAGAVALGGAAYAGERNRQLDRRRADSVAALRATVEDFRLTLGKQLRDAARVLQRDLRRAYGPTAADRIAGLSAALRADRGGQA